MLTYTLHLLGSKASLPKKLPLQRESVIPEWLKGVSVSRKSPNSIKNYQYWKTNQYFMSTSRFGAYSKGWRNQGKSARGISHACSDEFVNNLDGRTVKVFMNISVMSDRCLFMRKQTGFKNHATKNRTNVLKLKQKKNLKKTKSHSRRNQINYDTGNNWSGL